MVYCKLFMKDFVNSNKLICLNKFLNRNLSCKSGIGPLKDIDGKLCKDNEDKSCLLKRDF